MDEETAKAMSEFAGIEEQLNGIEKYAVSFLEEETRSIVRIIAGPQPIMN